uniref:C2H2-type domain-containing protein n=1 Tax=Cyprinodon variegatus TaxID=28743 RepID=A0A3Q2CSN1_CYPVA
MHYSFQSFDEAEPYPAVVFILPGLTLSLALHSVQTCDCNIRFVLSLTYNRKSFSVFVFPHRLQDYVGKEEDFTDQQLCEQERNSSLDQEEPEALQIKEEHQEPEHPWTKEETMKLPISEHEEQQRFPCLTCGKTFLNTEHLMVHFMNVCPVEKKFTKKSDLDRHMRIHTGEKHFECLSCGRSFSQKSDLDRHIPIHTGEKPFPCMISNKNFAVKNSLTKHVRIHTCEKPFCCTICGNSFTLKHYLINYMRIKIN